ncbi:MAG TPA: nitrate oxidoreductase subunit alpha, partial [Dehalococcoidia bacterium]|nr:nitrate oxidoreductase subunit alpha [Dehalococcoidia bacterium]
MELTRRELLKSLLAGAITPAALPASAPQLRALEPAVEVANPLEHYPNRDWEEVYPEQYSYDGTFTFVCSPNDTHECRIRAFLKNGIVSRVEQNYDVGRYADLEGNRATVAWNPRMCLK